MAAALALLPVAYFIGTFPTAHLVARARGHDVTREGSGNPGASNVYRILGAGPAAIVFAGDILKGAVPAAGGLFLWGHAGAYVLAAAAVLGHVYPVQRRFKGGRGVATAAGMALVVYPLVTAVLLVVFFVLWRTVRTPSVASIAVAVGLPVGVWVTGQAGWEIGAVGALSALVIARHSANVRRLVHGEELRIREERRPRPPENRRGAA